MKMLLTYNYKKILDIRLATSVTLLVYVYNGVDFQRYKLLVDPERYRVYIV